MNVGKKFEQTWRKCTPDYALLYRIPDAAQSFDRSHNLRFSAKNPFDYILWDSRKKILYALELKTVCKKAIKYERVLTDKGEIHRHQIEGLNEWNKYDGVKCGFVIFFREEERTVFVPIEGFNKILKEVPKKSFNLNDLTKYDIEHTEIGTQKVRTWYKFDVDGFLSGEQSVSVKEEFYEN